MSKILENHLRQSPLSTKCGTAASNFTEIATPQENSSIPYMNTIEWLVPKILFIIKVKTLVTIFIDITGKTIVGFKILISLRKLNISDKEM